MDSLTLDNIAKELNMSKTNLKRAILIERNLTDSMVDINMEKIGKNHFQDSHNGNSEKTTPGEIGGGHGQTCQNGISEKMPLEKIGKNYTQQCQNGTPEKLSLEKIGNGRKKECQNGIPKLTLNEIAKQLGTLSMDFPTQSWYT